MGNNVNPQQNYPLFQSMLEVLSLFKAQVQFDGDELPEVWIQCNCCKKIINFQISDVKQGNFTKKQI